VARKIKRAELVAEFLSAMRLHFNGDLRCQGEHRIKALRRLLTLRKLGSISPGEPSAREQLKKLLNDAVDWNDREFLDDFVRAWKETGLQNVSSTLKNYAFMVAEDLIREHEPKGTLPTKREIRLATLKMREHIRLILEDRDWSFRKLPEGEQRKKIEWELMCQDENSKFWTRFWKDAHLRDLPEDEGGQPSHWPTMDKK
jgi:hypothetical protein